MPWKTWAFSIVQKMVRRRPAPEIRREQIRKILVIKLCCLGDILFTTPLLRALGAGLPEARLCYLVSPWCEPVAAAAPGVSATVLYDPYASGSRFKKIIRAFRALLALRRGRFEAAVILHRTPGAGLLAWLAGIPIRVGLDWRGCGFALTHPVPFQDQAHEVDRYLECLRPFGLKPAGVEMQWRPPDEARKWARNFWERAGDFAPGPRVALFPAGGVNPGSVMLSKRWPLERFRELCRRLVSTYHAQLVLVGSKDDRPLGDELLRGEPYAGRVLRTEGQTTLVQLGALVGECAVMIGGDSGPVHLAAAAGTPVVALFGPSDPERVGPRGGRHRIVRASVPCAPCYTPSSVMEKDATQCHEGSFACMRSIAVEEVWAAVADILDGKGRSKA